MVVEEAVGLGFWKKDQNVFDYTCTLRACICTMSSSHGTREMVIQSHATACLGYRLDYFPRRDNNKGWNGPPSRPTPFPSSLRFALSIVVITNEFHWTQCVCLSDCLFISY